jgi:hypothetical protein
MRMGGPMHVFRDERNFFLASMWCDCPESMIRAFGEDIIAIKSCELPPFFGASSLGFFLASS